MEIEQGAGGTSGDGGTGGAAGAAAIAAAGGGGGGAVPGAAASWRDSLPEAMRGAPEIQNYQDLPAAVQGLIESKKAATARVPDFKTDDGLKLFADTVRPAEASEYEIPVPDGSSTKTADAFRAFAHEIGMPPGWARAVAEFHNGQVAEAIAAEEAASEKDVGALRDKMGAEKFDTALAGVNAMLPAFGVELEEGDLAKLDAKIGSANLLRFMFAVHARVGDPAPIENGGGGSNIAMTPDQAREQWNVRKKDPSWREQAKVPGTPEYKEAQRFTALITQGRAKKRS